MLLVSIPVPVANTNELDSKNENLGGRIDTLSVSGGCFSSQGILQVFFFVGLLFCCSFSFTCIHINGLRCLIIRKI